MAVDMDTLVVCPIYGKLRLPFFSPAPESGAHLSGCRCSSHHQYLLYSPIGWTVGHHKTSSEVSFMPKTSKRDLDRNVWEGWTPRAFINALEPSIRIIMNGESWRRPFTSKAELAEYCRDNQPYYKKRVPEVVSYFAEKYGLR